MKRIAIVMFLISLVIGQKIQQFDLKLKEKRKEEQNNDDIILKEPISAGAIIITAAISVTVGFICTKICEKIYYELTHSTFVDTYLEEGNARWLSNIEDGWVISAYYHKNVKHSATCQGGFGGGEQTRAIGEPGEWAIAFCKAGISGRKTFYNNLGNLR